MTTTQDLQEPGIVVPTGVRGNVAIPPADTAELTRLHYFDGKFLRAGDLTREQSYHRTLSELSNHADGAGIVHGMDCSHLAGDILEILPGLAIDPQGRVLRLASRISIGVGDLIEASRPRVERRSGGARAKDGTWGDCETVVGGETTPVTPGGAQLYLIVLSHIEALCGQEDVYGRLCEDACATTTDRPYVVEGVLVRAEPLTLTAPLPSSQAVALGAAHMRSQVASAYFADEAARVSSLISGAGLRSGIWCAGASFDTPPQIAVGLVARSAQTTVFFDPWTGRRELIDSPPRRYWAWRMAMRPWEVFLAQVLQFQCQLGDMTGPASTPGTMPDPCAPHGALLDELGQTLDEIMPTYVGDDERGRAYRKQLPRLRRQIQDAVDSIGAGSGDPGGRMLLNRGFVELPPAGYLPVDPVATVTIDEQVRRLIGDSLDLRFCAVRHDYVAHALEEAQHMDRISLLEGLEDAKRRPEVDVLVPDGHWLASNPRRTGIAFRGEAMWAPISWILLAPQEHLATLDLRKAYIHPAIAAPAQRSALAVRGAGRAAPIGTEGIDFCFAGTAAVPGAVDTQKLMRGLTKVGRTGTRRDLTDIASVTDAIREDGTDVRDNVANVTEAARVARSFNRASEETRGELDLEDSLDDPRVAGMWSTLSADSLGGLQPGEATDIHALLVIAVPFGGHATANGAEIKLDGEARLTAQAEVDAHTHTYEYDVSAKATRRLIQSGGGAPPEENVQTTASAKVRTSHSGGEIEVVIPAQKGLTIRVTGTWDGNPLQLTVGVTASTHAAEAPHESDVPLLKVVLGKDDAVLAPADQDHRRAVSALDIVEAALQRSGFAQQAAARLFPADAGPAADDHIAGPLDWVLFQRRRTIDCGGRAPAAPDPSPIGEPVTTSDYLVLHALVENPSSASTVWNAMVSDHVIDAFRELDSLGVTTARFRTRRPDLVSSAADLGDAVGARGGELFRLGIATVREVEKPLLAPRLQVVDDVFVDQGLPRRRDFASDVLEGLESSSIATEVGDGAIFVISLGGTVDHTVVGVLDRKLYKAISSGDFAALSDTTKIGTASFQRSTADFAEVDLRTIAELSLPTDCAAATVVVGPSAVSEEVLKDEARQIIRELGLRGSPGVSISEERQGDWPFATDYLTVLLVPSQA